MCTCVLTTSAPAFQVTGMHGPYTFTLIMHTCMDRCAQRQASLLAKSEATAATALQERTKQQVDDSRLLQHVVMPEEVHVPLAKWWATLCKDDRVIVCCPHRSHGLTGKPSNRQNKQLIEVVTLIQYES